MQNEDPSTPQLKENVSPSQADEFADPSTELEPIPLGKISRTEEQRARGRAKPSLRNSAEEFRKVQDEPLQGSTVIPLKEAPADLDLYPVESDDTKLASGDLLVVPSAEASKRRKKKASRRLSVSTGNNFS